MESLKKKKEPSRNFRVEKHNWNISLDTINRRFVIKKKNLWTWRSKLSNLKNREA
jgi:hypothetical protein